MCAAAYRGPDRETTMTLYDLGLSRPLLEFSGGSGEILRDVLD
jgi:hypothetical protein